MRIHLATTLLTWGLRLLPDDFRSKGELAGAVVSVCNEHLERIRADLEKRGYTK